MTCWPAAAARPDRTARAAAARSRASGPSCVEAVGTRADARDATAGLTLPAAAALGAGRQPSAIAEADDTPTRIQPIADRTPSVLIR